MNLIIDFGNTLVKLAVFEQNSLKEVVAVANEEFDLFFEKINKKFSKIDAVIISSVTKNQFLDLNRLKTQYPNVVVLDHQTPLPLLNKYATPETLGIDRIALAAGAVLKYPNTNVLVIDAGTCITYDIITENGEYLGGAISPGIAIRYKALNDYTAKLPLLPKTMPNDFIGDSTKTSIHSGVINGVLEEINGLVFSYRHRFADLTVILTGGDTDFLSERLKSSIFANPKFLLESLDLILEHNIR